MNSVSQKNWNDDTRRLEWSGGVKALRLLAERMEENKVDKEGYWSIQLLLSEDLPKILHFGKINGYENLPELTCKNLQLLTPFQKVAAHPTGALAIRRFLRGIIANDERETDLAMYEVTDIYEEIFDEPAMIPRFLAEMLHDL